MEAENEFVLSGQARIAHTQYQTIVTSDNHTIIADEPVDIGGTNTGMSPYNLLLASLASCTAITLRMYINRKMWVVDEITVDLDLFKNQSGITVESKLTFKGELNDEQRKRLITIADACPIHKILVGNIAINTSLKEA
ncbi:MULTISPECIES: OsmC family protein [unclassified Mucilaginibacter]|uniref:OsmC family protein n=1 Tax=unclassified Mucilaginibacter TaxID=2617802 RepID=UPI002AC96D47|nr:MULTISPECIES: OsmC family protein [unclassified Mucilaginibacter]MEB0261357.1 OsmC family protein [Mucilaginibacter sp. 10I4]MEB0278884.1 OsmC family protein [Mucilaginibacter sp. 10B2]MEB0299750.1 OsmC family protein [Mucilaginibacter sp. 5C4]WPX22066.1 OsmC family protein [Mucilaginibacter sp. 5C4]